MMDNTDRMDMELTTTQVAVSTAPSDAAFSKLRDLVITKLPSPNSRRVYGIAIDSFLAWWRERGLPAYDRECVSAYRAHLIETGASSAKVNLHMAAIRSLTAEAMYKGWIDPVTAQYIRDLPGLKKNAARPAHWLTREQANAMLALPDAGTLKGKRDRVLLGLLLSCGLRRSEVARLEVADVQERDGRPVISVMGKGKKRRLVCAPDSLRRAITEWLTAAGFTEGRLLRGVNKADRLEGDGVTDSWVYGIVCAYAAELGVRLAPHDCRRTLAKLARRGGAELDQIQAEFGHASVSQTQQYVGDNQSFTRGACDFAGLMV